MTFTEFKNEVCDTDDDHLPTIGFIYYKPELAEDENYEMAVHDILTITKPVVKMSVITDVYRTIEFFKLDLEFKSSYDTDINEVYQYLKEYEKDVSETWDDFTKCPAFCVQIVPNKKYLESFIHYMELQMPLHMSLVSSRMNQMPDTISMLFLLDRINLCDSGEAVDIDQSEIQKELDFERDREEYERRVQEETYERELKKQEYRDQMMSEIGSMLQEEDHVIRVDREDVDSDDDMY